MAIIREEGNGKSALLKLIYSPKLIEDYAEYGRKSGSEPRRAYQKFLAAI